MKLNDYKFEEDIDYEIEEEEKERLLDLDYQM